MTDTKSARRVDATETKKPLTTEIPLDIPVEVEGETYAKLHLRRPKGIDLHTATLTAQNDFEQELVLFANCCDVPLTVIQELDEIDLVKLQRTRLNFLSSPVTPKTYAGLRSA